MRYVVVAILLLTWLLLPGRVMADGVIVLDDSSRELSLAFPIPTRLVDSADVPAQVIHRPFDDALYAESTNEGPQAYWHKLTIRGRFADAGPKTFSLVIKNLVLQHLEIHQFDGDRLLTSSKLGILDDTSAGRLPHLGLSFEFEIASGQEVTLLIRKQTNGSTIFPVVIYSQDAFYDYMSQRNVFVGGVAIFLMMIALYNGVIGTMAKSRSYIWYLLFYMLTFVELSVLMGFGHFIWPQAVYGWLGSHILTINSLLGITAILFASRFLATKLYTPLFHQGGRYLLLLFAVLGIASLVIPEYSLFTVFVSLQAIFTLYILSMAVQAYRNGFAPARFFFLSWLCLLIGAAIGVGAYKNFLPVTDFTLHGLMIGALAELAVLSVALVDRHLFTEKVSIKRAYTDPQTQLPNYSFFRNQFAETLENSISGRKNLWLVMLKVKGIESFTGLLGYGVIAKVYAKFIEQIDECLDEQPWSLPVALPYGGESYLISLSGNQMLCVAVDVEKLNQYLEPLMRAASQPIEVDGVTSSLSVEIGIARYNTRKITLQEGYRRAQLALNQCEIRHAHWFKFNQELDLLSKQRLELLADLRLAIKNQELQCYLQPQFDSQKRLIGAEALVRWEHPQQGMISPGVFIPLAEQSFLVYRITRIMIEKVCRWLAKTDVPDDFHVSVNLSVLDLRERELLPYIEHCTGKYGIEPSRLIFEVTETAAMEGDQQFVAAVEQLHNMGFRVGLDDFGTGYSSLLYMQRMKPDIVKIDMGFVQSIHESEINRKIILAIVQIAQSTQALTVAEGVETELEYMTLMRLGVDYLQGYLLGRPLPEAEFTEAFLAFSPA